LKIQTFIAIDNGGLSNVMVENLPNATKRIRSAQVQKFILSILARSAHAGDHATGTRQ
jgi:hypothetical protein